MTAALEDSILQYIGANPGAQREAIRQRVGVGATSVWRALTKLVQENRLVISGRGRATGYTLAGTAVVRAYLQTPYNLRKPVQYRKEFIDNYIPGKTFYLSPAERERLRSQGTPLTALPAGTYTQRILERLLVDLSWASSRMEGNTYSILDTERLLQFGQEAVGKEHKEAVMILNHKEAIQYIATNISTIGVGRQDLLNIHALLADGLLTDPAMAGRLRRFPVVIGQSSYKPLDDRFEIEAEFEILLDKAAQITDPFEQSFFILVHVPYLQAFEDVNKRSSRIAANIPLLKADLAPMSFLTMDDRDYIDGLIGTYELNNVSLLRESYVGAYLASAENYRIIRAEVDHPDKAALAYREFVRSAIRRCVLEWKSFNPAEIKILEERENIPEADRESLLSYIERQFHGLHEGNAIRYRLTANDLNGLTR